MADISAFCGKNCEVKNDCYRFRCIKEEYQTYIHPPEEKPCPEFWPINGRKVCLPKDE